jgi:hypothetical protein
MVLFVQRVKDLRVGHKPIQPLAGIEPRLLRQRDRELPHGTERLDLLAALVQPRLAAQGGPSGSRLGWLGAHGSGPFPKVWLKLDP